MGDILRLLTRAQKLVRTAVDEAMTAHGVRIGQNLLLEVLWAQDGLTPGELSARLGVSTPTVVNTATRMEAAGLLVRRRDESDARLVRLYLTEHGRAVEEPIQGARGRLEEYATATLTAEERRVLATALTKIIERMTDGPGPALGEGSGRGPGPRGDG